MMRRYALRDDQWERIKPLLLGREGTVGVTAKDHRLFVEAVPYRYRAGIPWRDFPERLGSPVSPARLRQRPLQSPAPDRKPLPKTQTIQSACNPLRQTGPQLFSRHPPRRCLHLA